MKEKNKWKRNIKIITFESLNHQFKKFTKNKYVFSANLVLLKWLYLATKNISKSCIKYI